MSEVINTKQLRAMMAEIVARVRKGERYTVLYRSRPAFRIVPLDDLPEADGVAAEGDSLYRAPPLGRSRDGLGPKDYDDVIYGIRRTR